MPAAKLTPPIAAISDQKAGAAERAVRREHRREQHRLGVGRRAAWPLSAVMAIHYTERHGAKHQRKIASRPNRDGAPRRKSRPTAPAAKAAARPRQRRQAKSAKADKATPKHRCRGTSPGRRPRSRRRSAASATPIPSRRGELEHINPFTLLVAVVLSAQATDAGVNKATPALFALADTPEKMVALGEDRVRELIKTIGLFRTKAKNVIALSQKLDRRASAARCRATRAALEALPGVGRKTANVVLNMRVRRADHRGRHPYLPRRQPHRPGARQDAARGRDEAGETSCPQRIMLHAHHWLILHGRYVCMARRPRCDACLINDLCRWPEKRSSGRRMR